MSENMVGNAESDTDPQAIDVMLDAFATVLGQTMGWPALAGRTAGALLLSERPLSAQQLQDQLGASSGSLSEITRLLITHGVVRRFKEPGTRHFVYEWRPDAWIGCLEYQLRQTSRLRDLAHRTRSRGHTLPQPQRRRLEEMATYYDFMVTQLTALLDDYRARR